MRTLAHENDEMWKIAVVGTELAPLRESSGALERVVLAWVAGLERSPQRFEVTRLDADPLTGLPVGRLERSRPDLLILNNRPLWAEGTELPVLHVLHNYQDAWGAGADDQARVRRVLERGQVCAVSAALARHVEEAYRLPRVGEVRVGVEACFFGEQWRGGGGPVLFPNRLLEEKGGASLPRVGSRARSPLCHVPPPRPVAGADGRAGDPPPADRGERRGRVARATGDAIRDGGAVRNCGRGRLSLDPARGPRARRPRGPGGWGSPCDERPRRPRRGDLRAERGRSAPRRRRLAGGCRTSSRP